MMVRTLGSLLVLGVALVGPVPAQEPAPAGPRPDGPPPTPAEARVARQAGENLFHEGKYDAALREWKRVERVSADDPVVAYFIAACHARLRQHGKAITAFDRALALKPGWGPALSGRASCGLLSGDYAAAKRDFEAAIAVARAGKRAPDPRDVQLLEQALECAAGDGRAKIGAPAPLVRCRDSSGKSLAWRELLPETEPPKAVVLVFHGGMRSRHDVAQLSRLREHVARITGTGARLYCVSRDTPLENRILAEEKGLPFPMLSDSDGATTRAYGMVDLRRPGADRGTLLGVAVVDADGTLRHRQPLLDPEAGLDCKALAETAGKITGTPPPADDGDEGDARETPR